LPSQNTITADSGNKALSETFSDELLNWYDIQNTEPGEDAG